MPRLFTALEIPHTAVLSLSLLRGGLPAARWIDPENYHLTLRFIGDVEARLADEIVAVLDRIDRQDFALTLKGIASFGSRKPHSIYAAVEPCEALDDLQADIDRSLKRLGLPCDARKFTPHVTLARLRHPRPADVAKYLAERANFASPPFKVDRFGLFSARDSVGGGPYILEEAFDLHAPRPSRPADAPERAQALHFS